MKINWGDIEKSIETLRKVDGGFIPPTEALLPCRMGREPL